MGRSAYFIRLFGCPVQCPWCDSAGTWHPDYVPAAIERIGVEALAESAAESGAPFAVITGGEPAIHDLGPLTRALARRGLGRHLETSGAFPIRGDFDWITLSPKWQKLPLAETLAQASEFKLIVESKDSIQRWLEAIGPQLGARPVWLHPEWSQRANPEVLECITRAVKERGGAFRAGYQLHKLYKADALDPRSRAEAPLGGKPELGY